MVRILLSRAKIPKEGPSKVHQTGGSGLYHNFSEHLAITDQ